MKIWYTSSKSIKFSCIIINLLNNSTSECKNFLVFNVLRYFGRLLNNRGAVIVKKRFGIDSCTSGTLTELRLQVL